MRKNIRLTTNIFDITIHWNTGCVTGEFALLFGMLMIRLLSSELYILNMVKIALIVDIILVLVVLLFGAHITIEDAGNTTPVQKRESINVAVEYKANRTAKPTKESTKVISNKVATPTPTAPTPAPALETPVQSDKGGEEDWESLFSL